MKFKSISVQNVLGAAHAEIMTRGTLLIAGPNGAGKSSIAEAVRLAVLGEAPRGSGLKKDYPQLVHQGEASGLVAVEFDEGTVSIALPSGKREGKLPHQRALEFTLNPERFARLPQKERRAALLELLGVKITPAVVVEELAALGVDDKRAKLVTPLLAAGFDSAATEASCRARDAKAAWRAVTGEQYGSEKAKTWRAANVEAASEQELAQARELVKTRACEAEAATEHLSRLESQAAQAQQDAQKREQLQAQADMLPRLKVKLEHERTELATWEARVKEAEAMASGKKPGEECECPECGVSLVFHAGRLEVWTQEAKGSEVAAQMLPEHRRSRDLLLRASQNTARDLQQAEAAALALQAMGEGQVAPAASALEEAREARSKARQALQDAQASMERLTRLEAASAAAGKATQAAANHAQDVQAWEAIAEALSPQGIPAKMLARALTPLNEQLGRLAQIAQWPRVVLGEDMGLTVDGRAYEFRSESERWRADAMLAAALAIVTGAGFMMLDRFDVLDADGRVDALYWLSDMRDIVSALVLGTLKAVPDVRELGLDAVWMERGELMRVQEKAAA